MGDPIPPAPTPKWRFELLHRGCVHDTLFTTKIVFLGLDTVSMLGLLLLAGRLLRHRWRAEKRRQDRWAAVQAWDGDEVGKRGAGLQAGWRRWWAAVVGCTGWGSGPATTTRVTIGDLFERLVRRTTGEDGGRRVKQ